MNIKRFIWNVVDANSWLITEGKHGLLIDVVDNKELYEEITKLKDLTIVITHSHFDHICGLNYVRKIYPSSIVVTTNKCSKYIGDAHKNMSSLSDAFLCFYQNGVNKDYKINAFVCDEADVCFEDSYEFRWNDHHVMLEAFHGHSDDGLVCIIDDSYLFSGDSLLNVATATRLPRGSTKCFWMEDIPKLEKMNDTVKVYPGHGDSGKLADMIKVNCRPEKYSSV